MPRASARGGTHPAPSDGPPCPLRIPPPSLRRPSISLSEHASAAPRTPFRLPQRGPRRRIRCREPFPPRHPLFDYLPGYGLPPQIRRLSSVHRLGTAKLSRTASTGRLGPGHPPSSRACGFVDERSPQTVDNYVVPRACVAFSTGAPQAGGGCPQQIRASPHGCPLFGNPTSPLTGSSERRHRKLPDWVVGNLGIPGDTAGENCPQPVGGVCRTFRSPQRALVVHRLHPQGRWIKNPR